MNENIHERLISPELSNDALQAKLELIKHNDRGEPLTWGATPLAMTSEVNAQQLAVKKVIQELFSAKNTPDFISTNVASYIEMINMARTAQREARNTDSYMYRGVTSLDGIPFEAHDTLERAIKGLASPAELLFVADVLNIPTIELASLTHPYAQRIELLDDMRPAVNEAILMMDGTLIETPEQVFEVKGSDNPRDTSHMEALHMTRKKKLGDLSNGTEIIERSSFILLIDQLPEQIQRAIRAIPYENNEYWANQVRRAGELYEIVPALLSDKEYNDIAIPVSTTVVAINKMLSDELLTDEAMRQKRQLYLASYATKA